MSDSSPPSMSHAPMSAVLARVEKQLRELWSSSDPKDALRSRACTMNLVVVTSSPEIAEVYAPIIDEVTQAIPSRAIMVTMTPNAAVASLDGEVSAVCDVDETCSERVMMRATGAACARVGSIVESLVVPELPTTLIWLGRVHVEDPIFRELAEDAQRVVLDTDYTSLGSLLSLARFARESRAKIAVADLAWTRISVWQEMLARFFDDPSMRALAQKIESLRIVQMSAKNTRLGAEPALLLGWLATRLGWRIERLGGAIRFRRADGALIALELGAMPKPAGVASLALASVSLTARENTVKAAGSVARDFDGDVADVLRYKLDVNLPCSGEQIVRLGANKEARVLERTLHRAAFDETFAAAVAFAEQLDDDGLLCT